MDDALLMGCLESFGDLARDNERFIDVQARYAFRERRPFDQFHHQRAHRRLSCACWRGILNAVDMRDVGMVQRRQRLCFAMKSRQALGVGGDCIRQNLNRDLSTQSGVARG